VVSRFAVDFLVTRERADEAWKIYALEINLRMGRHDPSLPRIAVPHRRQPRSRLRPLPLADRARQVLPCHRQPALGNVPRPLPEDLVEILTINKLHYSHGSESGVLFHLIGALSEFGKVGVTAIANGREEVDELYSRTLEVLDRETSFGH
jgi:hypothetical protein